MKNIKNENRVICENPNSMFNYFAWPSVGRLPRPLNFKVSP